VKESCVRLLKVPSLPFLSGGVLEEEEEEDNGVDEGLDEGD